VVHPSADLGRFELVLAPSLFMLEQRNAEALGTFVQDGGHLVVGPFSAVADGNGHLAPGRFPGVLAELLGVDGEEWLPLASPLRVQFGSPVLTEQAEAPWHASIWAEDLALRAETAEAVAHFGEGPLEGKPAVVRNRKGEGNAWYVGADLPTAALDLVMVAALDSAGITSPLAAPLPEAVEAASRGGHLFLLNHSNLPQAVQLGWASVDLLTGAEHSEHLTLPPFGALVLKELGK
jgi:beta-galactosidase